MVDETAPEIAHKPYSERDDWIPDSLHVTGHVDTTGTGGDLAGRIEEISPVFAQARASAFASAVASIDHQGPGAPEGVVLPTEGREVEDAVDELRMAAEQATSNPQLSTGLSPAQQEAAQSTSPVVEPESEPESVVEEIQPSVEPVIPVEEPQPQAEPVNPEPDHADPLDKV